MLLDAQKAKMTWRAYANYDYLRLYNVKRSTITCSRIYCVGKYQGHTRYIKLYYTYIVQLYNNKTNI